MHQTLKENKLLIKIDSFPLPSLLKRPVTNVVNSNINVTRNFEVIVSCVKSNSIVYSSSHITEWVCVVRSGEHWWTPPPARNQIKAPTWLVGYPLWHSASLERVHRPEDLKKDVDTHPALPPSWHQGTHVHTDVFITRSIDNSDN